MEIEGGFSRISAELESARDRGIKPSVRESGPDWVCTLEDEESKFVIIAKEGELTLVTMKYEKGSPDVQRIHESAYTRQKIVDRVEHIIRDAYGD